MIEVIANDDTLDALLLSVQQKSAQASTDAGRSETARQATETARDTALIQIASARADAVSAVGSEGTEALQNLAGEEQQVAARLAAQEQAAEGAITSARADAVSAVGSEGTEALQNLAGEEQQVAARLAAQEQAAEGAITSARADAVSAVGARESGALQTLADQERDALTAIGAATALATPPPDRVLYADASFAGRGAPQFGAAEAAIAHARAVVQQSGGAVAIRLHFGAGGTPMALPAGESFDALAAEGVIVTPVTGGRGVSSSQALLLSLMLGEDLDFNAVEGRIDFGALRVPLTL